MVGTEFSSNWPQPRVWFNSAIRARFVNGKTKCVLNHHVLTSRGGTAFPTLNLKMRPWASTHQTVPDIYKEQFQVFGDLSTSGHVLCGSVRLFQMTHSWSAAFLNWGCASVPPPSPLHSEEPGFAAKQHGLTDLELLLFFPIKFRGSRTWMFVMIWADLVKKAGSSTYLLQQHTSNMGLTLFSLSWLFLDTEGSWTKLNRVKEWQNIRKVICHLHCHNNCAKLTVPPLLSSRLALDFCWMVFFLQPSLKPFLEHSYNWEKKTVFYWKAGFEEIYK